MPQDQLMRASGRRLSTNDALCALMWHVCCALRGRPPPGQGSPQQGYMVAIVDLRGRHLPEAYCGAGYLPCNIPGTGALSLLTTSRVSPGGYVKKPMKLRVANALPPSASLLIARGHTLPCQLVRFYKDGKMMVLIPLH